MASLSKKGRKSSPASHNTKIPAVTDRSIKTQISSGKLLALKVLLIVAAGLWVFGPSLHGDWLWDDSLYITENPLINDPDRLWKIWFVPGSQIEYYPIEQSLQWLQWQLWANRTLGYHLTNVFLHLIGSLLVWRLLSKFGLRLAWLGGLIFAIHPLQVESVAWISEFKNTLSLPLFLWTMCVYVDYEDHKRNRDYWEALILFALAMLCKNSMVFFPAILLLYAWWKRGKIGWSDLRASLPFFFVSVILASMTMYAGSQFTHIHSASPDAAAKPMASIYSQLALMSLAISYYFSKYFLPISLLPIYPPWSVNPPSLLDFLPGLFFGSGIFWIWSKRESWGRHALLGLLFYVIALSPVLSLIITRSTTMTWSLDHLVYIPIVGLIGLSVACLGQAQSHLPKPIRPYGIFLVTATVLLFSFSSHRYAGAFINSEALWSYCLKHGPESWQARRYLGMALVQDGRIYEGMEQYKLALRINPDSVAIYNNMGEALLKTDQYSEATKELEQALSLNPDYLQAHYNLGESFRLQGQILEAIEQYREAIRIYPGYAVAHHKLADCLVRSGDISGSLDEYDRTLQLDPDDFEAQNNLGGMLFKAGRTDEAMDHFAASLKINPDDPITHNNMGICLAKRGQIAEAIEQFEIALKIKPDYMSAQRNLSQMESIRKGEN